MKMCISNVKILGKLTDFWGGRDDSIPYSKYATNLSKCQGNGNELAVRHVLFLWWMTRCLGEENIYYLVPIRQYPLVLYLHAPININKIYVSVTCGEAGPLGILFPCIATPSPLTDGEWLNGEY